MSGQLGEKIRETVSSVLPITLIVLALTFTIAPVDNGVLVSFILGALLLIMGMGLFTLGVDISMTPMGQKVGSAITRSRRIWLIVICSFFIGLVVTVAEPDLQVLAGQVSSIPSMLLIWAVALGVGVFLVLAMLRTLLRIPLNLLLIICYGVLFILSIWVPENFLALAFDSGGVTTGPMTVPFIMALGVGAASMRNDKNAENDSFGLVALASVGPVLAMMILGVALGGGEADYSPVVIPDYVDSREVWTTFLSGFPHYLLEVAVALLPVVGLFLVFQLFTLKLKRRDLIKMAVGMGYTYFGLVLFLTGVNMGFLPAGNFIGQTLGASNSNWLLIPVAMIIGYFIVAAEPAVHVLNHQVEEITHGAIPRRTMLAALSIGVAVSLGLSMVRVLTGLDIMWLLLPGYAIAIALTFITPKIFTAVAFDSGGVASGPMTATFVLPFAMGACAAVGGNIVTDAFGVVAMVAMTPLIAIQTVGAYFGLKQRRLRRAHERELAALGDILAMTADIDIVELG